MHKFQLPIVDSGLVILSKYPIVESGFMPFANKGTGADLVAEKGCLWAKIELKKDVFVHVFNTHPQANYGDYEEAVQIEDSDSKKYDKIMKTYSVRISQMLEISQFLKKKIQKSTGQNLVMFMGDINIDAQAPEINKNILINMFSNNIIIIKFLENLNEKQTFSEYELLKYIIGRQKKNRVSDLGYKFFEYHPTTKTTIENYIENEAQIMDNYFCNPDKTKLESKTLDYIFT